MPYQFCAIIWRTRRRFFRKRTEWSWMIFDAQTREDAVEKVHSFKPGWNIAYLFVSIHDVPGEVLP